MPSGRSDHPPAELHGARWCEQHGRRECAKHSRRTGKPCHQIAIEGVDACQEHSGMSRAATKAKGQAALMRAAFAETIAAADYADPGDVLLWAVTISARQVAWLRSLLAERMTGDGKPQIDGDDLTALVKLEHDERRELARAAKSALDAGIAERQVRLAERVAEQLVAVLRGVVTELGHDPADPAVAGVVRRHLALVANT